MALLTSEIRRAIPADAPSIARVHETSWLQTYAGILPHKALRTMVGRRDVGWWLRAIRQSTSWA